MINFLIHKTIYMIICVEMVRLNFWCAGVTFMHSKSELQDEFYWWQELQHFWKVAYLQNFQSFFFSIRKIISNVPFGSNGPVWQMGRGRGETPSAQDLHAAAFHHMIFFVMLLMIWFFCYDFFCCSSYDFIPQSLRTRYRWRWLAPFVECRYYHIPKITSGIPLV